MSKKCLLREDKNGVCYLTINRPDKLNVLDSVLFREMEQHLLQLKQDDSIRVIVLKGAGRCFCAGHDVEALGAEGQDEVYNSRVVSMLADSKQAVVVIVHSYCYTGGLELALAGDIIIAGEGARISDTHSKFALRPAWGGSQRLPRRVGVHRAKDMFFTNRMFNGIQAERIGLVDYCYPDETLWLEAEALVQKISGNSPHSISFIKQIIRETDGQNIKEGLEREVADLDGIIGPDFEERVQILNKNKR